MAESQLRIDIRKSKRYDKLQWVVQQTAPVRDLFESSAYFENRAEALADFQDVCTALGWKNDVTEVPVR